MLDIILFQRDLKTQLLEKILEDIHLPPEEKAKIKKCLSSPSEMRAQLGFPSGPRSKTSPCKTKTAFLTGSSAVSEQYFEAVYTWVYTQEMHNVIEDHLCLQRTARDVIRMAPLSVDIETMKNMQLLQVKRKMVQMMQFMRETQTMTEQLKLSSAPKTHWRLQKRPINTRQRDLHWVPL